MMRIDVWYLATARLDMCAGMDTLLARVIEQLAYLTDVLTRLPTQPNSRIDELLPTRWQPAIDSLT